MKARTIATAVSVLLLLGCAGRTRARLEPRRITVLSTPSGAEVYRVGPVTDRRFLVGTTPVQDQRVDVLTHYHGMFLTEADVEAMAARVGKVHLVIEKPGYRAHQAVIAMEEDEPKTYSVRLEAELAIRGDQ